MERIGTSSSDNIQKNMFVRFALQIYLHVPFRKQIVNNLRADLPDYPLDGPAVMEMGDAGHLRCD
jgi:hypothetical protein